MIQALTDIPAKLAAPDQTIAASVGEDGVIVTGHLDQSREIETNPQRRDRASFSSLLEAFEGDHAPSPSEHLRQTPEEDGSPPSQNVRATTHVGNFHVGRDSNTVLDGNTLPIDGKVSPERVKPSTTDEIEMSASRRPRSDQADEGNHEVIASTPVRQRDPDRPVQEVNVVIDRAVAGNRVGNAISVEDVSLPAKVELRRQPSNEAETPTADRVRTAEPALDVTTPPPGTTPTFTSTPTLPLVATSRSAAAPSSAVTPSAASKKPNEPSLARLAVQPIQIDEIVGSRSGQPPKPKPDLAGANRETQPLPDLHRLPGRPESVAVDKGASLSSFAPSSDDTRAQASAQMIAQTGAAPAPATAIASVATAFAAVSASVVEQSAENRALPQVGATIENLVNSRELARSVRPELTLKHAEFGNISARIDAVNSDLRATLTNRDPGFISAIQTALAERALVPGSETQIPQNSRSQDGGSSSSFANSSGFLGSGQGFDGRYGSSTGSGQGSSQPYSEHHSRNERNGTSRDRGAGETTHRHHKGDPGLFA